jgi:hypothetical protein
VLPCVDVFVADRFFVWVPILQTRLALRLGAHLADVPFVVFRHPTCGRTDVPCVCVAEVHLDGQLADVPCVALGRPTFGRILCCVWVPILRTCLALLWGAQPWWGRIKNSTSKPKKFLIHPPARLFF